MLRLTLVFFIWLASTAYAGREAQEAAEAELCEAYERAWSETDREQRAVLERAQRAWNIYRAAHCRLIGEECLALMAQERAAELRALSVPPLTEYERSYYSRGHHGRSGD